MTNNKEDARIIKTRKRLLTATHELCTKKPFQEITVNEICDAADVRRATFYKHYKDKYDFLSAMADEMRRRFDEHVWEKLEHKYSRDYYTTYVEALITYIDEKDNVTEYVFSDNIEATVVYTIVASNYEKTKQRLIKDVERGLRIASTPEMVASILSSGIAAVIISWIKSGKSTPREQLINECKSVCNALILG